jgi:chromosomal replication initiation ATPase DnaA
MRQLALPFDEAPGFAAADFVDGPSNELARKWLGKPDYWTNGRLVLWGDAGCGKSHLLHIWATAHGAAVYEGLTLRGLPGLLDGPVAVDDADAAPDEAALLHLLNGAAEAGRPVLLTARLPPARQDFALADLASRLRGSLAVAILPPDEAMLDTLLTRLIAERQLALRLEVRNFLTSRLPRSPAAFREAIARLERAAAMGVKPNRAAAAGLLADLMDGEKLLQTRHFPEREGLL